MQLEVVHQLLGDRLFTIESEGEHILIIMLTTTQTNLFSANKHKWALIPAEKL